MRLARSETAGSSDADGAREFRASGRTIRRWKFKIRVNYSYLLPQNVRRSFVRLIATTLHGAECLPELGAAVLARRDERIY